ncbi:hypothetical protein ACQP1V_06140 [Microtetraspora malaysiensis]|uniref:hypothetical protein n=1 Tax=Microtetraspora malaysiensis TaxID=161358 RepID=UPI003D8FF7E5
MVEISHLLDELTCAACSTSNALWLYPMRGVVECRECGEKASVLPESLNGCDSLDGLDACGGDR